MSNLVKIETHGQEFDLEYEIQTVFVRVFKKGTTEQIGSCVLSASQVGEVIPKMFNLNPEHRNKKHSVLKVIGRLVQTLGFVRCHFQKATSTGLISKEKQLTAH